MRRRLVVAFCAFAVLVFAGTAQASSARPLLFVLAGQSNMVGHGFPVPFAAVSPRIDRVTLANTLAPAGPVLGERGDPSRDGSGAGPGLPFARTLIRHDSRVRVVLLMCAVGGTSITAWQPGQQFYDSCITRTRAALKFGRLAGVLFMQGETDAMMSVAPNWWLPDFMSYTSAVQGHVRRGADRLRSDRDGRGRRRAKRDSPRTGRRRAVLLPDGDHDRSADRGRSALHTTGVRRTRAAVCARVASHAGLLVESFSRSRNRSFFCHDRPMRAGACTIVLGGLLPLIAAPAASPTGTDACGPCVAAAPARDVDLRLGRGRDLLGHGREGDPGGGNRSLPRARRGASPRRREPAGGSRCRLRFS